MKIDTKKLAKLLKVASVKLSVQEKMLEHLVKVAEDAKKLEKSVEIAEKMWRKGLIESDEIFEKVAHIRQLPDKEIQKLEAQVDLISDSVFHKLGITSGNTDDSPEGIIARIFEED